MDCWRSAPARDGPEVTAEISDNRTYNRAADFLIVFRSTDVARRCELTTTSSNSSRQENQVLRDLPCTRIYTLCHFFNVHSLSLFLSTSRNPHFRAPFYDQIGQSVNNSLRIPSARNYAIAFRENSNSEKVQNIPKIRLEGVLNTFREFFRHFPGLSCTRVLSGKCQ